MKTLLLIFLLATTALAQDLETALRTGLYEEEANQDLPAAIAAYKEAITHFDTQREAAATAIFRLAECYSKAGEQKKAEELYARVVREFHDLETIRNLAQDRSKKESPEAPETNIQNAKIAELEKRFSESPDLINRPFEGDFPLNQAIIKGYERVADYLLANGADPSLGDPLHVAILMNRSDIVARLIEAGADVNRPVEFGEGLSLSPLHLAAYHGNLKITKMLKNAGATIEPTGIGPYAIQDDKDWPKGPSKSSPTAAVTEITTNDLTPLHIAVANEFIELTKLLIEFGSSPNSVAGNGDTPLYVAVRVSNNNLAKLLLDGGADANAGGSEGYSPLSLAAEKLSISLVKTLLGANAQPDGGPESTNPPVVSAINARSMKLLEMLAQAGHDFSKSYSNGWAPLHSAAAEGWTEVVPFLVGKKANLEAKLDTGETPLMYAARGVDSNIVEALIAAGADIEATDSQGDTPLLKSCRSRENREEQNQTISILIEAGANLNHQNNTGDSPLITTIKNNCSVGTIKLLLTNGAFPNLQSESGDTALHYAAGSSAEIVEMLLEHGADPEIRNEDGIRPGFNGGSTEISNILEKFRIYRGISGQREKKISVVLPESSPSHAKAKIFSFQDEPCRNTLFELIAACRSSALFEHARILRLQKSGEPDQVIEVDVRAAVKAKDPTKDIALEWGDVIELTSDSKEPGISEEAASFLDEYLRRCVKVTFFGSVDRTDDLTIRPISWEPSNVEGFVLPSDKITYSDETLTGGWSYLDLRNLLKIPAGVTGGNLNLKEIKREISGGLVRRYNSRGYPFLLDGDEIKIGIIYERDSQNSE